MSLSQQPACLLEAVTIHRACGLAACGDADCADALQALHVRGIYYSCVVDLGNNTGRMCFGPLKNRFHTYLLVSRPFPDALRALLRSQVLDDAMSLGHQNERPCLARVLVCNNTRVWLYSLLSSVAIKHCFRYVDPQVLHSHSPADEARVCL